jgi:DNA modification methylase
MTKLSEQKNFGFDNRKKIGPVECLGMTFENDEARRAYFTEKLREKLKDPEFRKIEGFPIGEDEDILALSDPPYYTACPNPWLADFVKRYGHSYKPKEKYHREPFAADVSEGKMHPIYKAHAYHTKVPHRAIMRYILHYTQPGEIVLDGFCGTGMMGVAAQLCGDREEVQALGYRVQDDGTILDEQGRPFSKLGFRRAILNDLSPVATFIATNYASTFDVSAFEREAKLILREVEEEIGWMYQTNHKDGKGKCRINFTVWSEVFTCPECSNEIIFVKEAFDAKTKTVRDEFDCPQCSATLTKKRLELMYDSYFDSVVGETLKRPKRIPVLINYSNGKSKFEKEPDEHDLEVLKRIEKLELPQEVPTTKLPPMQMARVGRMQTTAITYLHQFFLPRAAHFLAAIWRRATATQDQTLRHMMLFFVEQAIWTASVLNRYRPSGYSQVNQYLSGVFYVPSQHAELSPWYILEGKLSRLVKTFTTAFTQNALSSIGTMDCASMEVPERSVDYIFTDPPFGENIYYSDLDILIGSWHKVLTNAGPEAIVDRVKGKDLKDYQKLMLKCFEQYFRALKPGRWITVEFSNSQATVWNAIQTMLQEAGFVVANVAMLDKKQRSFQSVTSPIAVKQDLVISAYKPNGGLEERFSKTAETDTGVWDFVRTHLGNLPVAKPRGGQLEPIAERDPRILFDRTLAFYIRHGIPVPISSPEFQAGLAEKFPERDGMYFLSKQAAEYDKVRMKMEGIGQLTLFVEDERSAVAWLRNYLKNKPCKYQDIQPEFFEQLNQSWKKWETRPELRALLEQYFLCYNGQENVPSQIHSYLSTNFKELRKLSADDPSLRSKAKDRWYVPDPRKNADVEKLREKRLLEEFWTYLPPGYDIDAIKRRVRSGQETIPGFESPPPKIPKGKRLKLVRTEAVRVGFKQCYQIRDYQTIIAVAHYIPEDVVNGDDQLQMIYDSAVTRSGLEI